MLYIGVMSGTSCDGIDVALVKIDGQTIQCQASYFQGYEPQLKAQLLAVIAGQPCAASVFNQLDQQLAKAYTAAIKQLLSEHKLSAKDIQAVGLHGQTIDHQPPVNTWQLGSATHVATSTGIDVVADFRTMDVALGGQGAPLAPALHQTLFYQNEPMVALNLGGIANVSLLDASGCLGFDTGPANCLMDLWSQKHLNAHHDEAGQWATRGTVNIGLLNRFLSEPYFSQEPPKSTGRELFNEQWLAAHLADFDQLPAVDVQATLLQLTAQSIADAVTKFMSDAKHMVVCGGGVHNRALMAKLRELLNMDVLSSAHFGVDPDHVESTLMAWLAACHQQNTQLDLVAVTGASQAHCYGVLYPAL